MHTFHILLGAKVAQKEVRVGYYRCFCQNVENTLWGLNGLPKGDGILHFYT